ncbi:MAG: glycoside hydrolase family 3 C-terminal domain-containing protein [Clostridia bacterium]|nr:glycoside hydrolase family 3 C-terminal domain-containing protein [Clostridia bacterium]
MENLPKYKNPALPIKERVEDLISRMTPEEKAAQTDMMPGVAFATKPSKIHNCSVEPDTEYYIDKIEEEFGHTGVGFVHDNYAIPSTMNRVQKYFIENTRLGIPVIFTGEALHGIGGTRGTVFPSPIGLGASFDKDIVNRVGQAIGKETRSLGMQEILAPNLDIARETRWGRTEETFGEDTYLSSRMAVAIVSGEQKGDVSRKDAVAAEPKHYCFYGIPEAGTNCSPARIGRREAESVYLPVFEAAIKEGGAYNVMVSYNSIDGDVMMCSEHYLKKTLKEKLGLRGYARADWGGVEKVKSGHKLVKTDREAIKKCINNGLDMKGLDYPNKFWRETVTDLIKTGEIPMARIDDIVRRVLTLKFELGLFEHPYTDENAWEGIIRCDEHKQIALEAARKSMTLLKNNGVLPLSKDIKSIAVIGPSSAAQKIGGYSSTPTGYEVKSVYQEIKELFGDKITVRQHDGCAITPDKKTPRYIEGQPHLASEGEDEIPDDIEGAVKTASECDCIIFVGGDNSLTCGEWSDRCDYVLPGKQRELIKQLAKLGKKLIVVLEVGRPVDLTVEKDICDGILCAWFGGEFGAKAITETLFGLNNPAGRVNVSFPKNVGSIPCYYSMLPGGSEVYYEGPKKARYPFGFGLSYTTFEYSDITTEKKGRYDVEVSVTVKNTGKLAGDEVVQLYIDDVESSVATPPMLLKGFDRVHFEPGEEKRITFTLNKESFSLIDINYEKTVEPGEFRILVGASSDDIRLETSIELD